MFIAVLFSIASELKQDKYPSNDEWVMTMPGIYYGILFSCLKK